MGITKHRTGILSRIKLADVSRSSDKASYKKGFKKETEIGSRENKKALLLDRQKLNDLIRELDSTGSKRLS